MTRLGWRGHGRLAGGYFEAHRLAIGKSRLERASGGFVSSGKEKKPILMKEERRTTFTRPRGFFVSECIRALCVSPRERRSLSRFNCKFLLPDLLANCSTEPVKPLPLRAPVINTEFLTKIIYSLKIIFIFFSFFFLSYITVFFFVRFRYNGRYGLYIEWKRGYVKKIFVAKADSWTRCNELQLWRCRVSMGLRPRNKLWK